jgi:hypothetical protein
MYDVVSKKQKMNTEMQKKISKIGNPVLKVVLASTILTLIIVILASIYYLGYLKGVALQAEEGEEITASSLEITPVPTTFPSPTTKPRPVLPTQQKKVTYGLSVNWGGPELWDAVNKKRLEYGVNPLKLREDLCTIASIRLNELIELGKLPKKQFLFGKIH